MARQHLQQRLGRQAQELPWETKNLLGGVAGATQAPTNAAGSFLSQNVLVVWWGGGGCGKGAWGGGGGGGWEQSNQQPARPAWVGVCPTSAVGAVAGGAGWGGGMVLLGTEGM